MFNIPIGYENPEALITFFRERFSKQDPIRVEFSHGYSEKKLKAVKERIDALPEEHRLFIDVENLSIPLSTATRKSPTSLGYSRSISRNFSSSDFRPKTVNKGLWNLRKTQLHVWGSL